MTEESIDTELLGQSAFYKLEHGFAIRDRLRDALAEQQAIVANNQVDLGGVTVEPEPPGGVISAVNRGVVAKGSVLARVEFARPIRPGKTEVTLRPVFAVEQAFRNVDQDGAEQWLVVGDAMNEIGPDVVEAVTYLLSAHKRDCENSSMKERDGTEA